MMDLALEESIVFGNAIAVVMVFIVIPAIFYIVMWVAGSIATAIKHRKMAKKAKAKAERLERLEAKRKMRGL